MLRGGVARHVGQRFLHHAVDRRLQLGAEPWQPTVRDRDVEMIGIGKLLGVAPERGDQAEVIQGRGPKPARDAPDVTDRLRGQVTQPLALRLDVFAVGGLLDAAQADEDGGERLAGRVGAPEDPRPRVAR